MAEIIVSAILGPVIETLTSAVIKKLGRSKGITEPLEKWERLLMQIQAVLFDASQKEIAEESVKQWLDGLRHLVYDIDDMLDDLATQDMHHKFIDESRGNIMKVRKIIPTCCTSISPSTRMKDKLDSITIKLQNLAEEKNTLGLTVKVGKSNKLNRELETSLVDVSSIVGRQEDKEALLQKLLRDEPSNKNFTIVPIVGLGGVGKTTLAQLLYNDKQVKDRFDLRAWVCVSDELDILKVTSVIFQSVDGGNKKFPDLNLLQVALKERLSEKRFLLVLDDVWTESYADWQLLSRPFLVGAPGSKIIMTTRKMQLLNQLGYDQPYRLQILSEEDALSLFCQQALDENNFDLRPTLKPHGEGIVKKCNGLPLALIALGRLLRTKPNEEEWKELLNSKIWKLQHRNEIIPALMLSYHDLPSYLKQLFAYCSLFPKDYMFVKDELVQLWMAEGFLHQSLEMERLGCKYFDELLTRSFFQYAPNGESLYVMHDLMNDLATFVAGHFFFRFDNEMVEDVKKEALEKNRHMSFVREEYGDYRKFKVFERAKSLRTFLAVSVGVKKSWQSFYISNKILVDLLPQFPLLRVLSLSDYRISEIPESIGSLKHLRYLNLSHTGITYLPEQVGNLYNLQTLLVRGCASLKNLPRSLLKLKKMRHLDIRGTPLLEKMPLGISELKSLQTLSKVIIEGGNGFAINELKDIKDLHGRLHLKGLDKVKSATDAKYANLLEKEINELKMEWSNVFDGARNKTLDEEILNVLEPCHDKLRKLKIVSYGGMEFPSWVGDPSFHRLEHVMIRGCENCPSLPPLGQLYKLKELFVGGMHGVKVVGSELLRGGNHYDGVAFPSLEILSFEDMQGWESWSINNGAFPRIQELRIRDCNNLVDTSLEALPSLRVLEISGCGDGVLRSIVCAASSVIRLKMENISGLTQLHRGVLEFLGAIEDLGISRCNELRYMWGSEVEASKILVNIRKLEIWECCNLESIGETEDVNCGSTLTSLRDMRIYFCDRLERFNCPNSIQELIMFGCLSITRISFSTGGQKLKTLRISNCE